MDNFDLFQFGLIVAVVCFFFGVIGGYYFLPCPSAEPSELSVEKETSMVERVRVISSQWDGCWLSVGEEDNALYWKCDGFTSKIGDWYCFEQKEAVE